MMGPPQVALPSKEVFAIMGAENLQRMIADFYVELAQSSIAHLFPQPLDGAIQRSYWYFAGLLGGPATYVEQRGHPRLRQRHMGFAIDEAAKNEWLRCFENVLVDAPTRYSFPVQHLPVFKNFLHAFAAWMVNRGES